jgi:hypothetical protein
MKKLMVNHPHKLFQNCGLSLSFSHGQVVRKLLVVREFLVPSMPTRASYTH